MPESWEGVDFDEVDVLDSEGMPRVDARLAGDEAVDGLDKITAQMAGGEHRSEQQEMCRAVAEALATRTHLVVQAGTGTGKSLAYLVEPRWRKAPVLHDYQTTEHRGDSEIVVLIKGIRSPSPPGAAEMLLPDPEQVAEKHRHLIQRLRTLAST